MRFVGTWLYTPADDGSLPVPRFEAHCEEQEHSGTLTSLHEQATIVRLNTAEYITHLNRHRLNGTMSELGGPLVGEDTVEHVIGFTGKSKSTLHYHPTMENTIACMGAVVVIQNLKMDTNRIFAWPRQ